MNNGIIQSADAFGGGSANALISQVGRIGIHATALAFGDDSGFANAAVHSGIFQSASATSGDAYATINLAGDNSIVANATATGADGIAVANASVGGTTQVSHTYVTIGSGIGVYYTTDTLMAGSPRSRLQAAAAMPRPTSTIADRWKSARMLMRPLRRRPSRTRSSRTA